MRLCLNLSTSLASHHPVTALQQERSKLGSDADHGGALEKLAGLLEAKSVAGVAKIHGRPRKHEWAIYPSFAVLVVIFLLLLPRACRYP
jgi:hypothetical protein